MLHGWAGSKKPYLFCSLVGFLKSKVDGLRQAEEWIDRCWGKIPDKIQRLGKQAVWINFISEKEVEEFLHSVEAEGESSSPYSVLERWMECMGPPPNPVGLKIQGAPLHVWHEDVFKLIGNCLGRTVEVDYRQQKQGLSGSRESEGDPGQHSFLTKISVHLGGRGEIPCYSREKRICDEF